MDEYYLQINGNQQGPYTRDELLKRREAGHLPADCHAWTDGMAEWRPLQDVLPEAMPPAPSRPAVPSSAVVGAVYEPLARPRRPAPAGAEKTTSKMAITSLVLGILGLFLSFLVSIPAIVLGHMARSRIKRSQGAVGGSGMAKTGLILGYIFTILPIAITLLIPTVGRVREAARRTTDASHIRQIGQASLIVAANHYDELPKGETIYEVAFMLAAGARLNDGAIWFSASDPAINHPSEFTPVLDSMGTGINPDFTSHRAVSFDFVSGLAASDPSTTPIAWTRGLRPDGTWASDSVYRGDGGHIIFMGGNLAFFQHTKGEDGLGIFINPTSGERTSNVLEALPPGTSVVGAGPSTLDGRGRADY